MCVAMHVTTRDMSLYIYRIAGNIRGVQILFFLFSDYQNENLTHKTYVMMGIFSCVKWTE